MPETTSNAQLLCLLLCRRWVRRGLQGSESRRLGNAVTLVRRETGEDRADIYDHFISAAQEIEGIRDSADLKMV